MDLENKSKLELVKIADGYEGLRWSLAHDAADGRFPNDRETSESLRKLREKRDQIVRELRRRTGIEDDLGLRFYIKKRLNSEEVDEDRIHRIAFEEEIKKARNSMGEYSSLAPFMRRAQEFAELSGKVEEEEFEEVREEIYREDLGIKIEQARGSAESGKVDRVRQTLKGISPYLKVEGISLNDEQKQEIVETMNIAYSNGIQRKAEEIEKILEGEGSQQIPKVESVLGSIENYMELLKDSF